MLRIVLGVFMILHGLVHLLYYGQSARIFELKAGMAWPDGSWAFSKLLGEATTRGLASVLLVAAALGFIAGGAGLLLDQSWWRTVVAVVAVFSSTLFLLFWDGGMQNLDGKGIIAILINIAILALVLVWKPVK